MKSKITNHATIIIGLLLLAVSLYLIKTSNDPQGIMRTLPYTDQYQNNYIHVLYPCIR